jgi:hypothetical protein
MSKMKKYVELAEHFQALSMAATRMAVELDGIGPEGGRLDRSVSMLENALAKMAAELHRKAISDYHPDLVRADVNLFVAPFHPTSRDLVEAYDQKGDTSR